MKILHTGRARKSGSWAVRGEQLGRHPVYMASPSIIAKYDVVVVVKRLPIELLRSIESQRKPWVWDLVDFYPQPACNDWTREQAVQWVKGQVKRARPSGVIFPNEQMQKDCALKLPSTVIYHHHRPDIVENPIRDRVQIVGYEGGPQYLGPWQRVIEVECAKRGWQFVINPKRLADVDICVAFRDGDAYVPRHWKSNVKLANAHGSGTPFIGTPECGYLETQTRMESWAQSAQELSLAFDDLTPKSVRQCISQIFRKSCITVDDCREQLETFIHAL